jgi:hypothetical protein
MNEPTVLDYLKSIFDKNKRKLLNTQFYSEEPKKKKSVSGNSAATKNGRTGEKYLYLGIILAFIGQFLLEPPQGNIILPSILYLMAIILFWVSLSSDRFYKNENLPANNEFQPSFKINLWFFLPSLSFLAYAFFLFSNNQFTYQNLFFWISGIAIFIFSIWQFNEKSLKTQKIPLNFYLTCGMVILLTAFFRFFLLNKVPGEMFSDHAEKLLDVMDILDGKAPIFFVRNTGREALQFYLTAAIIKILNTGISFISLKLGTAFLGFLTLPFIYLLGKQLFNKWAGVLASLFAGIAYWPNVISRVGLRFPLYPLFTAITLYFLIKGLQEKRHNMLLFAGLFIGLGLHGYSPIRIVPILVAIIFLIYFSSEKTRTNRIFAMNGFILMAISALIVFLPLFRYVLENLNNFNYRALSRLTSMENPINGSVLVIFLTNLWKSLIMVFYKNGVVWVNSIPDRPALDVVSSVFFLYGLIILIRRYGKTKTWQDLSLIISIPILMLPSVMSLAFPNENPALNRSGGAIVPIFIIIGIGFYHFIKVIFEANENKISKFVGGLIAVTLILISMLQNFDLVFSKYANQFLANAWNSSEIGGVISQFVDRGNSPDNAFVVPFPHWVDTRLVGINAGFPRKDYALWADDIKTTLDIVGEKIYILMPQDRKALDTLKLLYPQAEEEFYYSKISGKNFIILKVKS